jgi:hypothetical protein
MEREGNEIDLNYINNANKDKTYFTKSFMNKYIEGNGRFAYKILEMYEEEYYDTAERAKEIIRKNQISIQNRMGLVNLLHLHKHI